MRAGGGVPLSVTMAVVIAITLSGCGTAQRSPEQVVVVPLEKNDADVPVVTRFVSEPPRAGMAVVYIGRPRFRSSTVFSIPIEFDGKEIAKLGSNEYARIEVAPGRHEVTLADNGWARAIAGQAHPVQFHAQPGNAYFFRMTKWYGNPRTSVIMVPGTVYAENKLTAQTSFTQTVASAAAPPPPEFLPMALSRPE